MKNRVLLLTLKVFATTGGIEKVCRVAGKTLFEKSATEGSHFRLYSMYDHTSDADENRYFPTELFHGFSTRKLRFIFSVLKNAHKYDVVVLSHINLLIVGWMIKLIYPKKKLFLFAHGIEVWGKMSNFRKRMIMRCDRILSVSKYTSDVLQQAQGIPSEKITVINNCLDPFLPLGKEFVGRNDLRKKYGLTENDQVLFALTRISSRERYKGYDKVLQSMVLLKEKYPNLKYLIAGSYDAEEKKYLDELTNRLGLTKDLIIAGFIPDEELVAHFSMADIYVMPSMKEGFGIVFIEAMYYGLPVIAGNKDGSVDALLDGKLGKLVDPQDVEQIAAAIHEILQNKDNAIPDRNVLMEHFSYENYKSHWDRLLQGINQK